MEYFDTSLNLLVSNEFVNKEIEQTPTCSFESFKEKLPQPIWEHHSAEIEAYWQAWKIAHKNIANPSANSGFVSAFIDTAFNDCIFMWDSCFILFFAKYASAAVHLQKTLDNFYAKQHKDGYISREINYRNGEEKFFKFDYSSTGPNILAWCEWNYFLHTHDLGRLNKVLSPLMAYHRWMSMNRTWQNGSYWNTGWGGGMDNQHRSNYSILCNFGSAHHHAWLSAIDATAQALVSAEIIIKMAHAAGSDLDISDIKSESLRLREFIESKMWDANKNFYFDVNRDGEQGKVMTVGAYWLLLSELLDPTRRSIMVEKLMDEKHFKRYHRVPSVSASDPQFDSLGAYWLGGVWAPTTYMVLKGLHQNKCYQLEYEIARNHFEKVIEVYKSTGTFWEFYAPDSSEIGGGGKDDANENRPYKPRSEFVGWSGLAPIAILIENIFGIQIDAVNNQVQIYCQELQAHGIKKLPFGNNGFINVFVDQRQSGNEEPSVVVESKLDLSIKILWDDGHRFKVIPSIMIN